MNQINWVDVIDGCVFDVERENIFFITSYGKKWVNTMKRFTGANMFANINFCYNILELSVAKHTNIHMLYSKYLQKENLMCHMKWRNPLEQYI